MSTADAEVRRQRASLRVALRDGDLLSAARAWERLRVHPDALSARERLAARAARAAVGRAIRDARWRRSHPLPGPTPVAAAEVIPVQALRRYRRGIAIAATLFAALSLILVLLPSPKEAPAPAAAPPEERSQITPQETPDLGGRGRTTSLATPVAAAVPTPQPTPQPTPPPSEAPASTRPGPATGAPGGLPGGVEGGVPGGVVGGVPGGVVGGTGKATPAPQPSVNVLPLNPPPLAVGQDRFVFRVVDSRSLQPLANVCVVYGTITCGPEDPHTNVNGLYWLDVTPNSSNWNFRFYLDPDYLSAQFTRSATPGMGTKTTEIRLRHQ